MAQAAWPLVQRKFGETTRRDAWWVQPLVVLLALSAFIIYATWAAFQGEHFEYGPYLSPFYSPLLFGDSSHAWFGPKPGWWPGALPFSAALLILWAPGGFRSPATIIVALTTNRSGPTLPDARWVSRASGISASARFPSCCRTCTGTSCTWG